MNDDLDQLVLTLGGREIPDPWDQVRRYCGLPWSGGAPETWAFCYYDAVDSDPDRLEPVDVLATAALHPGLSRQDLAFFWDQRAALDSWIRELPASASLRVADEATIEHLIGLRDWQDGPNFGLLTKVLHRKRPALIPLVDRHVIDWYRPITGERSATAAWPGLLQAMRDDVATNNTALERMTQELEVGTARRVTALRIIDIAIWVGGAR